MVDVQKKNLYELVLLLTEITLGNKDIGPEYHDNLCEQLKKVETDVASMCKYKLQWVNAEGVPRTYYLNTEKEVIDDVARLKAEGCKFIRGYYPNTFYPFIQSRDNF